MGKMRKFTAGVRVMGVLNVSPESFYKGSVKTKRWALVAAAQKMVEDGADILDIGAMSTAPYLKTKISEAEETERLAEAVYAIKPSCPVPISLDTSRFRPALEGLAMGGEIINDISGLQADPQMARLAKKAKGWILMANPGTSSLKKLAHPINDTQKILSRALKQAKAYGIPKKNLVLDPGIGFFRKTKLNWVDWDLAVLRDLKKLKKLGCPLLVGVSRKSFIGEILKKAPPEERLYGSLGATAAAVINGASLVRTHDVRATKEFLTNFAAAFGGRTDTSVLLPAVLS